MKIITWAGILLILVGALALILQHVSYTEKDTVLDLGALKASAEHKKTVPIPPVVGGVAIISGIILIVAGARKV